MNLQELKQLIESKKSKGFFEDSSPEVKPLARSIIEEEFDDSIVFESIKKHTGKVSASLLEQYHGEASSKKLTSNPIVLDILETSQFRIGNKYLFVIEDNVVALSKEALGQLTEQDTSIKSIREKLKHV